MLLLTGFDHDLRGRALAAFRARLARGAGRHRLPSRLPRAGQRRGGVGARPRRRRAAMGRDDALGWGRFPGQAAWRSCRGCRSTRRRRGASGAALGDAARRAAAGAAGRHAVPGRRGAGGAAAVVAGALGRAGAAAGRRAAAPARRQPDAAALRRGGALEPAAQPRRGRASGRAISTARRFATTGPRRRPAAAPLVVLGDLNLDPFDGDGLRDGIARCSRIRAAGPGARERGRRGGGGAGRRQRRPRRRRRRSTPPTGATRRPGQPAGRLRAALGRAPVAAPACSGRRRATAGRRGGRASAHRLVWVDIALP